MKRYPFCTFQDDEVVYLRDLFVYQGAEYVRPRSGIYLKLNFFLWSMRRNLQFDDGHSRLGFVFWYRTDVVQVLLRVSGFMKI